MISDSASAPALSPLTARDYRLFRWALALPFLGLVSSPVFAVLAALVRAPDRVQEAGAALVAFTLMILGFLTLRRINPDPRYRLFVDQALAGSAAAAVLKGLVMLHPFRGSLHVADLVSAGAGLCFVLALRRLVTATSWAEGLRPRIHRSVVLVALFWVGTTLLLIPLSMCNPTAHPVFEKSWLYFLLLVLQAVPAIQVLRVLRDLYRDAALRNNLLVIRGRRPKVG